MTVRLPAPPRLAASIGLRSRLVDLGSRVPAQASVPRAASILWQLVLADPSLRRVAGGPEGLADLAQAVTLWAFDAHWGPRASALGDPMLATYRAHLPDHPAGAAVRRARRSGWDPLDALGAGFLAAAARPVAGGGQVLRFLQAVDRGLVDPRALGHRLEGRPRPLTFPGFGPWPRPGIPLDPAAGPLYRAAMAVAEAADEPRPSVWVSRAVRADGLGFTADELDAWYLVEAVERWIVFT